MGGIGSQGAPPAPKKTFESGGSSDPWGESKTSHKQRSAPSKGMQLSKPKGAGGATKKQALFADLGGIEELVAAGKKEGAEEEKHSVLTETVLLEVAESVNCTLSRGF